jgi:hypothetical protein
VLDHQNANARWALAINDRVRKVGGGEAQSPARVLRSKPGVGEEQLGNALELGEEAGGERR